MAPIVGVELAPLLGGRSCSRARALVPKSTVGGLAIAASFSTAKFGLVWYLKIIAVRLLGNERMVTL